MTTEQDALNAFMSFDTDLSDEQLAQLALGKAADVNAAIMQAVWGPGGINEIAAQQRIDARLAAAEKLAKAVEEVLEAESPYDRLRELRAALEHWREVSQ